MLNLSSNHIEWLDSVAFSMNKKLKELHLSYNNIECLDPEIFSLNQNLKELNLRHNKLNDIDSHLFDRLINLKFLNLIDNPMTVTGELFDIIPKEVVERLDKLKCVLISSGEMSSRNWYS